MDLSVFKKHISASFNLDDEQVEKLFDEFNACFHETAPDYVRRRHGELKSEGLKNESIYPRLLDEITRRRFSAGNLTERQIRRIIYG
jgi:hypothetical protein